MQNKMLTKYLLPSYVGSALFLLVAVGITDVAVKEAKTPRTYWHDDSVSDNAFSTYFLCAIAIIAMLGLTGFCAGVFPKMTRRKFDRLTRDFLHCIFAQYPDMHRYQSVLNDKNKVRQIAAVVFNGLGKQEQKAILSLLNEHYHFTSASHIRNYDLIAYRNIVDLIRKYADNNPEYAERILEAIKTAHRPNVISVRQKTR